MQESTEKIRLRAKIDLDLVVSRLMFDDPVVSSELASFYFDAWRRNE